MKFDLSSFSEIPAHIRAAANACAYDLLYGPCYAAKPESGNWEDFTDDDLLTYADLSDYDRSEYTETYTGPVGNMLRDFLESLPSTLYADEDGLLIGDEEPESEFIEDEDGPDELDGVAGYWCEPSPYYQLERRDIVEALFGQTIAREFN